MADVTLSGAGLVGSLLAVYLAKRGYSVEIFEKRADMRRESISAGRSINLALANRGIRALEKVDLGEKVHQLTIPMRGRMIHDEAGNLNLQAYGQREHEVIYSVSRAALNKLLMNEAEQTGNVRINFNCEIRNIDFGKSQLEIVTDGSNSVQSFERIIGTDGGGSAVRRAILNLESEQNSEEMLDHSYKELCIPAGEGGSFQIEKEALHIWPRGEFMLIALPNLDGSFTVTLFMPNADFARLDSPQSVDEFFSIYFPDAKAIIPTLEEDFAKNPTGVLGTVRCRPWYFKNKALVLGDAAHAIVPFHGQGMNCGFEDCLEFDGVLEKETDWEKIFQKTQALRKPNADAIADLALENYIEMRSSVRDPLFLLKKEIGFELERAYPDKCVPRYSLVMFHKIPYAEAKRRGEKLDQVLTSLARGIDKADQLDWQMAENLVSRL